MDLGRDNNATAQPVVSGKKIYPLASPLPPLAEQKRIVARLEELLPLCERLK
jgi:type I restriction enzyme S subunit